MQQRLKLRSEYHIDQDYRKWGMDLLDSIRESLTWGMKVVFYTAYDKYMMSAIRQSAFDYLLKPFEDKDLELIISRFMERIELERKAAFFPAALAARMSFVGVNTINV